MAKTNPFVPVALVVEDDEMQREMVAMLLQESEMGVIQCEKAEAALDVLEKMGALLSMMFTDVNLTGHIDDIHVIVTSGRALTKDLPDGATFMPKPWMALDLLREAERSQH